MDIKPIDKRITKKLEEIKNFCGLELEPCSFFNKVKTRNKKQFFSVDVSNHKLDFDRIYNILMGLVTKKVIQGVEYNGYKRLGIVIKKR